MGLFLGITLSEAREQQKIPLKKIAQDTKISLKYLRALEEEDFTVFPAEVYLKGFLKSYAQYLRLDYSELLKAYEQQYGHQPLSKEPLSKSRGQKSFWSILPFFIWLSVSILIVSLFILVTRTH